MNVAREIEREFTRDFTLIGRMTTCDSIGAVPFIMTTLCKQYGWPITVHDKICITSCYFVYN